MMQKKYLKLFLILMIFVMPSIIGHYLYQHHAQFSLKTTNYGILLSQPIQIEKLSSSKNSKPQWQIVYIPQTCADNQTDKIMFSIHQLRKALGNNRDRVALTLVVDNKCQIKDTHDFAKIVFDDQQYKNLENHLSSINPMHQEVTNSAGLGLSKNKIYLIDPLGNLFMYYPSDTDKMHILKDLKHLLEVSQIG